MTVIKKVIKIEEIDIKFILVAKNRKYNLKIIVLAQIYNLNLILF